MTIKNKQFKTWKEADMFEKNLIYVNSRRTIGRLTNKGKPIIQWQDWDDEPTHSSYRG